MKKLLYLFAILFAVVFAACDNGQPEGPSGDSNVPEKPSSPTTGSFVAKPFSVSATKTVTFSPGNLQYHPVNDEWRFAPSQLDYIGEANANISKTYNGWIDLFCWGTGNNPTNASTDYNDYQTFVDWGVNQIGNDAPNTWRTLTYEEWEYIINGRSNASNLKGVAQVNGVNGLILLPDGWTCPSGVTFKYGFHNNHGTEYYAEYQTFSSSEWTKLEASGAVFFPAAGSRKGSDVYYVQSDGYYWSATESNSRRAHNLYSYSYGARVLFSNRFYGQSVRLVTTLVSPQEPNKPSDPSTPEEPSNPSNPSNPSDSEEPSNPNNTPQGFVAKPFSVSATKTVTFSPGNLQYHPVNDEWRFAPSQLDYVGADNAKISPSYNGWIDSFGWGTGNNPANNSTNNEDYPTFVDWGVNKIGNDAPNTWRTLTYDEWYYLCYERPNYDKLFGVAQVNGVNGLILLPDSWICPSGVTFKSGIYEDEGEEYYDYAEQTFSASDWSKLEASGAVFFPAAGARDGSDFDTVHYVGYYWSATEFYSGYVYDFYFAPVEAGMSRLDRRIGHSVRLVQD
ncbi:MAG: hypothetical protein IKC81_04055 [Paludibacteraceae bacterium]|nr:hypothetical protein [Paludibacteraceae bacterium]